MVPFIVVGIAAAAIFFGSGCSENPASEKSPDPGPPPSPPSPPPSPPPKPPTPAPQPAPPSPAPPEEPKISSEPPESDSPEADRAPQAPAGPQEKRKLSSEELQRIGEELRKCLQVQSKYKYDCPPPEELPPQCKCEVIRRIDPFDPATPQRVRDQLVPGKPADPSIPNS